MRLWILLIIVIILSGCGQNPTVGDVVKEVKEPEIFEVEPIIKQPIETTLPEENLTQENIAFIEIRNLNFYPSEITIPVGTTVVWQHKDRWAEVLKHKITIYLTKPPGISPILYRGDSYNYTFTEVKKHRFMDPIYAETMDGLITVIE